MTLSQAGDEATPAPFVSAFSVVELFFTFFVLFVIRSAIGYYTDVQNALALQAASSRTPSDRHDRVAAISPQSRYPKTSMVVRMAAVIKDFMWTMRA